MKEVYLLVVVIFLIAYIFSTHDDPYIPIRNRKVEAPTKRKIISWHSWRGPMFIEDFGGQTDGSNPGKVPRSNKLSDCDGKGAAEYVKSQSWPHKKMGTCSGKEYDNIYIGHTLSDNPMALPSDPEECCGYNEHKRQKHLADLKDCHKYAMSYCRQPNSEETAQKSWENKYFNCSYIMRGPNPATGDLGNYKQCTNNNLDAANQLKCIGQGVLDADTCSPEHLVSHVCYKQNLDQCMRGFGHKTY